MPASSGDTDERAGRRRLPYDVVVVGGLAIATTAVVWYAATPEPPSRQGHVAAKVPPRHIASNTIAPTARSYPSNADTDVDKAFIDTLPAQFADTRLDGDITLDARGQLQASLALRRLYDYFLSGYGAYPGDDPVAGVRDALARYAAARHLAPNASSALLDLFDRYVQLQQRIDTESPAFVDDTLAGRLQRLHDMRRAELGPVVAEAFFGASERASANALSRGRANTPPPANSPAGLAADVAAARARGATDADIQRLRETRVGPDATRRLEALDARRAAWTARYAAYAAERARIDASALSADDEASARKRLRETYFSDPAEQRRAAARDRITASTSAGRQSAAGQP